MARPKSITDLQLLNSARESFLRNGHSISIQDIAKEIGISHAAIFQRYGSKRELLIESLKPRVKFAWAQQLLDGPRSVEDIRLHMSLLCDQMNHYFREVAPCMRVLHSAGVLPFEVFEGGNLPTLDVMNYLVAWIEKGKERKLIRDHIDCKSAASVIVGALFARSYFKNHVLTSSSGLVEEEKIDFDAILGEMKGMVEFFIAAVIVY